MAPTRSERIPADGTAGNGSTAGSDTWSRTRWPVGGRAGDRGECADRDGGRRALSRAKTVMPSMVLVWADGGYAVRLVAWVAEHCRMTLDIVRKPKGKQGFSVLPHRWLIERTLAWIVRCRRLGHDYERLPEHSEAIIKWAMIGLMSRRPVPARARRLGQSTSRPARRDTFATPSKTNRKLLAILYPEIDDVCNRTGVRRAVRRPERGSSGHPSAIPRVTPAFHDRTQLAGRQRDRPCS